MALEVLDYINLSLALLATIPMVIIFRQYLQTKFHDYLIFSAIFISSFLSFSINVLASITDLLILYKLHHIALNSIYFFIFLHAVRTNKVRTHSLRRYLGFIWYISLTVLILFWEKYEHPDTALTLFGNMSKDNISYDPLGAGLITDSGRVIYSTGFGILAQAYYIFAIAMLFIIYIRVKPVNPTKMIIRAKKFWIIASGLILLFWILHL